MKRFIFLCLLAGSLGGIGCIEGVAQTAACKSYVACLAARDTQLKIKTDYTRFAENGACWGGPEGAALCNRACTNGLAWLQSAYTDLPTACKP